MRSQFPGHFHPTREEIENLWKNALFIFDANILLNLYRYSDETREEFFRIIDIIKDRIWLTNQAAYEFFENRLTVISKQEKSYEEAEKSLQMLETDFENSHQHPFIDEKLLEDLSDLSNKICQNLRKNKDIHTKRYNKDDILEKIEKIFTGKVGNEYTSDQLNNIYQEGEKRFLEKIPPGYKDKDKKDDTSGNIRKFGDLILWKQILEASENFKKDVILITDDKKEDWWVRFNGKTISPRPELKKEFQNITKQSFYMYQSHRFLQLATENLNEKVNEDAIKEVINLQENDKRKRLYGKFKSDEYINRKIHLTKTIERISELEEYLSKLTSRENEIKVNLSKYKKNSKENDLDILDIKDIQELSDNLELLNHTKKEVSNRIEKLLAKEHNQKKILEALYYKMKNY